MRSQQIRVLLFVAIVFFAVVAIVAVNQIQQNTAPQNANAASFPGFKLTYLASKPAAPIKPNDTISVTVSVMLPAGTVTQPKPPIVPPTQPTTPTQVAGGACTTDANCKAPANGGTAICRGGICENKDCPAGQTIPGANYECKSTARTCGQTCGSSVGLCGEGTTCRFVSGAACTGNEFTPSTYCVPPTVDNGSAPGWVKAQCTAGGNSYVTLNGQNPTANQIQQLCGTTEPPVLGASTQCQTLWWTDTTNKTCTQKSFCGAYAYAGLQTFTTQAACQQAATGTQCQNLWWADNTDKTCSTQKSFCGAYMYSGLQTFTTQANCQQTVAKGSVASIVTSAEVVITFSPDNFVVTSVDTPPSLIVTNKIIDNTAGTITFDAVNSGGIAFGDGQVLATIKLKVQPFIGLVSAALGIDPTSKLGVPNIAVGNFADMKLTIPLGTTATCPAPTPAAPGFCTGGVITDGGKDANGCQLPPKCTMPGGATKVAGDACATTAECKAPANGGVAVCRNGKCENSACPAGQTTPGANYDCASTARTCGQTCGASVGLCGDGISTCRFVSGAACTGSDQTNSSYCVPNTVSTGNVSGWVQAQCSTGGNSYVTLNAQNPTATQVQQLCKQVTGTTPTPICPAIDPPLPGFCANGTIVVGGKDANGCQLPPKCVTNTTQCPVIDPAPGFCANGTIIPGGKDANGCTLPPSCQTTSTNGSTGILCTQEVKLCPDGTFVSRDSNNGCQFKTCPAVARSVDCTPLPACYYATGGSTSTCSVPLTVGINWCQPATQPDATSCKADYDHSGTVDAADLAVFALNYKKQGIDCSLDIVGTGQSCYLDISDLLALSKVYNQKDACKTN